MTYGIGRSRTRFVVLALLSLVLMGLDTYTDSLKQTRPIVGLIVVPVHLVAMIPGLILARANSLPLDVVRLQQDYQALKGSPPRGAKIPKWWWWGGGNIT